MRRVDLFLSLEKFLLDPQVGILHALQFERREAGSPTFFHFTVYPCDTRPVFNRPCLPRVGAASSDLDRGRTAALSRAVASYCAAGGPEERTFLSTSASLHRPHVRPEEFARYSREQCAEPGFPWQPFDDETPIRWTEAEVPGTGQQLLIPAALVFVPYDPGLGTGEAPVVQPWVTGLACDPDPSQATLSAFYDVIRDDALAIAWQIGLAPPHLLIETLSDANYQRVSQFERTGLSVTLLWLAPESGVPVILATLTGSHTETPFLVCAGGASLDPEEAVRDALEALAHAYWRYQDVRARHPRRTMDDPAGVVTDADHVLFWWNHDKAPLCRFLFSSRERVEFEELLSTSQGEAAADLDLLLGRLRDTGFRPLVVDLTTADVRSLGLHVVRGVIPGYQPLALGIAMQPRGGKRLAQAAGAPGLRSDSLPHPYAAHGFYYE